MLSWFCEWEMNMLASAAKLRRHKRSCLLFTALMWRTSVGRWLKNLLLVYSDDNNDTYLPCLSSFPCSYLKVNLSYLIFNYEDLMFFSINKAAFVYQPKWKLWFGKFVYSYSQQGRLHHLILTCGIATKPSFEIVFAKQYSNHILDGAFDVKLWPEKSYFEGRDVATLKIRTEMSISASIIVATGVMFARFEGTSKWIRMLHQPIAIVRLWIFFVGTEVSLEISQGSASSRMMWWWMILMYCQQQQTKVAQLRVWLCSFLQT